MRYVIISYQSVIYPKRDIVAYTTLIPIDIVKVNSSMKIIVMK